MTLAAPQAGQRHSVTALFASRQDIDKAKADLVAAGFPESDITILEGYAAMVEAKPPRPQSVLTSLLNIFVFMPENDRASVEEALRRGAIALGVRSDPSHYERAVDILDRDGAIDLDERQLDWARETAPQPRAATDIRPAAAAGAADAEAIAHPDFRERIGVGTASMMVGMDPAPAHAEPEDEAAAPASEAGPADAAPAANAGAPEAAIPRDPPQRRRVRSYAGSSDDIPRGLDPAI